MVGVRNAKSRLALRNWHAIWVRINMASIWIDLAIKRLLADHTAAGVGIGDVTQTNDGLPSYHYDQKGKRGKPFHLQNTPTMAKSALLQ
jgi:hypothetical protein